SGTRCPGWASTAARCLPNTASTTSRLPRSRARGHSPILWLFRAVPGTRSSVHPWSESTGAATRLCAGQASPSGELSGQFDDAVSVLGTRTQGADHGGGQAVSAQLVHERGSIVRVYAQQQTAAGLGVGRDQGAQLVFVAAPAQHGL